MLDHAPPQTHRPDDLPAVEPRIARLRRHAALVRTLLDEIDHVARPGDSGALSSQIIDEVGELGCRLIEAATLMTRELGPAAGGDLALYTDRPVALPHAGMWAR